MRARLREGPGSDGVYSGVEGGGDGEEREEGSMNDDGVIVVENWYYVERKEVSCMGKRILRNLQDGLRGSREEKDVAGLTCHIAFEINRRK